MAPQVMPEIDLNLCIVCGDCVAACPASALSLSQETVLLDQERCAYCGDCEDICPQGAIRLPFEVVLLDQDANAEGKRQDGQARDCQD